jgi:hypothetical protein
MIAGNPEQKMAPKKEGTGFLASLKWGIELNPSSRHVDKPEECKTLVLKEATGVRLLLLSLAFFSSEPVP